jgi:hypothetical protein
MTTISTSKPDMTEAAHVAKFIVGKTAPKATTGQRVSAKSCAQCQGGDSGKCDHRRSQHALSP